MDFINDQRHNRQYDQVLRENYRMKSTDPAKRQFQSSTFIKPALSPTKTNVLQSSTTFRTLTAQKLQRHTTSQVRISTKPKPAARGTSSVANFNDYFAGANQIRASS